MKLKLSEDKTIKVPKILYHLYNNAKAIKNILIETDKDELVSVWGGKIKKFDNIEEAWLELVDKQSGLKKGETSLIYKAGLRVR